mgnify:CR=1 FL=1
MPLLLLVSLIWAFSFGLVKHLTAGLDSAFIAATRLAIALLVFLPFLRCRGLAFPTRLAFAGIGAVQFGLMYLAYNESLRYLKSHEVAVLTLTTPLFVTLLADTFDRTFRFRALLAAVLAVIGGGVIVMKTAPSAGTVTGVLLIQFSNLAFAFGQVCYRRLRTQPAQAALRDRDVFGLLYAGAFALTLPASLARTNFSALPLNATNLGILLYLGLIASGLGFFLWNLGATRVSAGTLAVLNNLKIPLAVAVSLVVFRESADLPRLLVGAAIMAFAVWIAERKPAAG